MASLKNRFLLSVLYPLNFFLKLTGVFVVRPIAKWKRNLISFWSYFWLALCIQANIYIFKKRTSNILNFLLFHPINSDKQIFEFINILFLLNGMVIDTVTHANLISTISSTIELFLDSLHSVDRDLRRPNFSSCLNRSSFIGVPYLLATVRFGIKLFA